MQRVRKKRLAFWLYESDYRYTQSSRKYLVVDSPSFRQRRRRCSRQMRFNSPFTDARLGFRYFAPRLRRIAFGRKTSTGRRSSLGGEATSSVQRCVCRLFLIGQGTGKSSRPECPATILRSAGREKDSPFPDYSRDRRARSEHDQTTTVVFAADTVDASRTNDDDYDEMFPARSARGATHVPDAER